MRTALWSPAGRASGVNLIQPCDSWQPEGLYVAVAEGPDTFLKETVSRGLWGAYCPTEAEQSALGPLPDPGRQVGGQAQVTREQDGWKPHTPLHLVTQEPHLVVPRAKRSCSCPLHGFVPPDTQGSRQRWLRGGGPKRPGCIPSAGHVMGGVARVTRTAKGPASLTL